MANGDDTTKYRVLVSLAQIDPTRTVELIDTHGKGKPEFLLDQLRSVVAVGLAGESPEEAASIAETIKDPATISWSFTEIVDKLPARARAQKVDLLAQAQLQACGSSQPGLKLRVLGRIADRWLDLGETERAQKLLREGIDPLRAVAMVEALPDDPGLDNTLPKNAARRMAAEMLAKQGDDRWKEARVWAVSMWRPVGSDL
jgi:hypothetical protein